MSDMPSAYEPAGFPALQRHLKRQSSPVKPDPIAHETEQLCRIRETTAALSVLAQVLSAVNASCEMHHRTGDIAKARAVVDIGARVNEIIEAVRKGGAS